MAKIKELLHIQSSYSAQVDLKKEFNDRNLKQERMSHYKPIKAHRKAFETIAEGAYVKNSKRCFILSGSYGTGKSHLLLMAANYFESQSDTKEMIEFFKNYTESEENETEKKAEILKKVRKERRYLVCICDYGVNSFETYVLRSIKDALDREGISEQEMDSYYLQAINKINEGNQVTIVIFMIDWRSC
jgi:predicted ATP-dependent serine protease